MDSKRFSGNTGQENDLSVQILSLKMKTLAPVERVITKVTTTRYLQSWQPLVSQPSFK